MQRKSAIILAIVSLCVPEFVGSAPALAQISGSPTGWCHNRDGSVSPCVDGGSLIVEREIVVIPGPPIIVWKRPSAEGSVQSEFGAITNPAMQRELNDWSQTSWMLYNKGDTALKRGDTAAALAYLEAARKHNPPPDELPEINNALRRARAMFDQGGSLNSPFKFHKTYHAVALPPAIFNSGRKDLEPLRQELLPILVDQQNALNKIRSLDTASTSEKEMNEAKANLQKAQETVQKKIQEAKKTYVLD